MDIRSRDLITATHWGTYNVAVDSGRVTGLKDFSEDGDPSPIGHGIVDVLDGPTRIKAPMVRKSWLEGGPGTAGEKRGEDAFVEVSWAEANRLVAAELRRVKSEYGNSSIYAGSYGWASAGRFHHAQGQLKRFLNCMGGFTRSVNTYSYAAAEVIVPHVLGTWYQMLADTTGWDTIVERCELFVAFGGVPLKNGQISQGGTGNHIQKQGVLASHEAGVKFVNISPIRSDVLETVGAEWLAPRPSTDAALIIALSYALLAENLHDTAFLQKYTTGFERYAAYLTGETDGVAKTPEWASEICELPADEIRNLARRMASHRTMISIAWALTRQDHGEQPYWAAINLAAMLGQIGLPGTGIGFGYSATNKSGQSLRNMHFASFPQGKNPIRKFIPVARIADMLENPGGTFEYNGQTHEYPDAKIVWWAGGNPFHHHQDLNRLRKAWAKPDTVIVNEWCWNSLARHADIVLPCSTTLERSDLALNPRDAYQVVMDKAIEPVGLAKSDHDIFKGIAAEMDLEEAFTEGRTPDEWQKWMYEISRQSASRSEFELPDWDTMQKQGWLKVPPPDKPAVMMEAFRRDPEANPLKTPSGKIEVFSETVAGFGYADCPGHPAWMEPGEWLGNVQTYPLHMISNQPRTKLHSQLDHGSVSRANQIDGREPLTMHPDDAAARNLRDGQIVRIFNSRGACYAGLRISDEVRPGVIQIATGAWYEPDGNECRHGNPNVLTLDKGTSSLAQGPTAHSCLVDVAAAPADIPASRAYDPPVIE